MDGGPRRPEGHAPPPLASGGGLSRTPDYPAHNARAGRGGANLSQRPWRREHRLEHGLEDQPLGPPARRRPRPQAHRLHCGRLRDAAAISRRGTRAAPCSGPRLAQRQRQGPARPRRIHGGYPMEGRQGYEIPRRVLSAATAEDQGQWRDEDDSVRAGGEQKMTEETAIAPTLTAQ